MLNQQTIARLNQLRLHGMAEALSNQPGNPDYQELSFEERLGMIVDFEHTYRQNRRMARLITQARLKLPACMEDIDYQQSRGLDRALIRTLSSCQWIESNLNVLITGPAGVGKTFLACALAQAACRQGMSARYYRVSLLLTELAMARGDGTFTRLLRQLSKFNLLVLDDWALAPFPPEQARDLLEILDDRSETSSVIIASQIPMEHWHQSLPDPTLADAILDRIAHNSHRITLKGESMRKIGARSRKAVQPKS